MEEIAYQRGLKSTTIYGHLADLIANNYGDIDINTLVSPERQQVILEAIAILGDEHLTTIYEHLGKAYSYGEIQLVRALWRSQNSPDIEF